MNSTWSDQVGQAFGNAAESYDANAPNQLRCAETLVEWMSSRLPAGQVRQALEIGCGTGFLTRKVVQKFSTTQWLVSDISALMIAHCRANLFRSGFDLSNVNFVAANGEKLDSVVEEQEFDLICSNLAFQWFEDLDDGLRRIVDRLRPAGRLFFSTLGPANLSKLQSTFPCLRTTLHRGHTKEQIAETLSPFGRIEFDSVRSSSSFGDLAQFLNSMKLVGASTPRPHANLSTPELRAAVRLSRSSQQDVIADYDFLLVGFQKGFAE